MKNHNRQIKYLSQSLLLEEKANPLILQILILFFVFIVAIFIIWATYMEIDEVTIAPGKIVPTEKIHKVQHLDGGVLKNIAVKDGEHVTKGMVLLELNEETILSELHQNESKLSAYKKKLVFLKEQVKIRSGLYKRGLNSKMSFLTLQAEESDLEGKIEETMQVVAHLKDQLSKLKVISPIDGIVHGLGNRTAGAILGASEVVMEILPLHRKLVAEVQISASEIGHVKESQKVTLKFNTYDFGKYGGSLELLGDISPTTLLDQNSGKPYYRGKINLSSNFLGNTNTLPILPGMTLTAEIKTGKKTIIEYLLKPVFISAKNAFREK